jgi:hypothetical protein
MLLYMRIWALCLVSTAAALAATAPAYNDAGDLLRPTDYREWIYLSSGVGMTYGPAAAIGRNLPPFFDNVFVTRDAYHAFIETGRWPDKTMFVLEIRYPQTHGSINKDGYFQTDVAAIEAAVKDEQRFPDKWAYFNFPTRGGVAAASAKALSRSAGCFGCHTANGAVENTFVQFYPTLLEAAEKKGTLKTSFQRWTPSPAGVYHMVESGNWNAARDAMAKARTEDPQSLIAREESMNQLAYSLLGAGRKADSITVLKEATSVFPKSANLVDSLSEMYEANGQKSEALAAAQRGVSLLDGDTSLTPQRKELIEKSLRERIARLSKTD